MRSTPLLTAHLLVLGACAHAAPPEARLREAAVPGEVAVLVRHAPGDEEAASQIRRALGAAITAAERWGRLEGPLTITVHPSHGALEAAARRPGRPWLRAWARVDRIDLQSPRTWTRGEASDEELAQLLTHELTHCAMFQAIGGEARPRRAIPLWFKEGMATVSAGERHGVGSAALEGGGALLGAASADPADLPSAYAAADRAFRLLLARYGEARIRGVLAGMRNGAEFADAFEAALGLSVEAFAAQLTVAVVGGASAAPPRRGAPPS